jgi:hypothetical protein
MTKYTALCLTSYDIELLLPFSILVRKPEGKRPLRRPKYRWEDKY